MGVGALRIGLLGGLVAIVASAQNTVGVIRSGPLPSPQEIAVLESNVLQNPDDLEAQLRLLQVYASIAPLPGHDDPVRRSVRLQHILYLVEHHPEAAVSGSRAAYVGRMAGAYENAGDHEAVREQWLAAVAGHPKNEAVTTNAVKFLEVEDPDDAEQIMRRAVDAEPENRELAANLGFLYATEIKGPDLLLRGRSPASLGRERPLHAMAELEQSSNPVVLAAAGTALANLAKSFDSVDGTMLELGEKLLARARELAPADPDIQGPMPLIKYFAAAQSPNGRR